MIIGSKHIFIENLPSTNTYVSQLIKDSELPEGSVIRTNYQSSGKGQMGNSWESEAGKNLLVSVILYPIMTNPADQFYISMVISLGICDFLKRYTSQTYIKWPNDIYINDDKIAGILIENTIMGDKILNSIAGVGLNINQEKFLSNAPNPVSLSKISGKIYDLSICLDELCSDLDKRYKQLIADELQAIKREYLFSMYRLNEWHGFRDKKGIYEGRIIDISDTGCLCIEKRSGEFTEYVFKEVDFIP